MKTIALEIGSYAIKVLTLESTFRTLQIFDFSYHPLDPTLPEGEAQKKALAEIIRPQALAGDRVIVAFPGENCSSKMIQLPFRDRRKIIQALPFELEEQIPFPLEEIVWGWNITAEEEKKTEILCIFSSKTSTATYLHELQQQGIDPDVLQPAPLSFAPLCDYRFTSSTENFAVLDVGHKRTQMALFLGRKLALVRTIMAGGHDITTALMSQHRLSYEEAEKRKQEMGGILIGEKTASSAEHAKLSQIVTESLSSLLAEINQTLQVVRSKKRKAISQIFLCGGTSQLPGFAEHLAEETRTEVAPFKFLQHFDVSHNMLSDEPYMALPLGLALSISRKSPFIVVNFRQKELAKVKTKEVSSEHSRLATRFLTLLLLLGVLHIGTQRFLIGQEKQKLDRKISVIAQRFPIKIQSSILASPTRLQAFLDKQIKEQRVKLTAFGPSKEMTTLQTVQILSQLIPKEITTDVREFTVTEGKIKIKALTDSFNSVDRIEKAIKDSPYFTNVVKGPVVTATDGTNKDFSITFDVKTP